MSFLFEDDVLAQLIIDSGVFGELNKYAQQANAEAKLIAVKLAQQLGSQAIDDSGANDAEIYVQDLVDLDSYLNFLLKNEERSDGKLIVYHDAIGTSPPEDAQNYTKYKEFYVLKDALLVRLHELDTASQQVGNEIMKPLVKHLISQINSVFNSSYESNKLSPNPYGEGNDKAKELSKVNPGGTLVGQNVKDDGQYQNVVDKTNIGKPQVNKISQEDLTALRNSLPFQQDTMLSPYDITLFIRSINTLLHKHNDLLSGPMLGQFERLNTAIEGNWASWQNFISRVGSKPGGGNTEGLRDEVPYDRANRPNVTLETLFRNNFDAKEAAQRLLQFVMLAQEALLDITRSPKMVGLISKDIVNNQSAHAKAFADSLTPFARS